MLRHFRMGMHFRRCRYSFMVDIRKGLMVPSFCISSIIRCLIVSCFWVLIRVIHGQV